VLDVVNLRLGHAGGPQPGSLAEPFMTLAELQRQGLIRHLGVSNATAEQVAEARAIAPIVCVQNMYNLACRQDDELIDMLAGQGIAYVPFFPLGGFSPLQSSALSAVAARLEPRRCRWPWPGCCSAHRTSCSSRAPPPPHTCARTSPARDSGSRAKTWPSWTRSVMNNVLQLNIVQ
jgi:hypothetical protein